jgi:hypothetical protein
MRSMIVALLVVLGVFTFETGLHAVHHLGHIDEPESGCSFASAGGHLDVANSIDVAPPLLTLVPVAAVVEPVRARVAARATTLPPERAPPPSLAA